MYSHNLLYLLFTVTLFFSILFFHTLVFSIFSLSISQFFYHFFLYFTPSFFLFSPLFFFSLHFTLSFHGEVWCVGHFFSFFFSYKRSLVSLRVALSHSPPSYSTPNSSSTTSLYAFTLSQHNKLLPIISFGPRFSL